MCAPSSAQCCLQIKTTDMAGAIRSDRQNLKMQVGEEMWGISHVFSGWGWQPAASSTPRATVQQHFLTAAAQCSLDQKLCCISCQPQLSPAVCAMVHPSALMQTPCRCFLQELDVLFKKPLWDSVGPIAQEAAIAAQAAASTSPSPSPTPEPSAAAAAQGACRSPGPPHRGAAGNRKDRYDANNAEAGPSSSTGPAARAGRRAACPFFGEESNSDTASWDSDWEAP